MEQIDVLRKELVKGAAGISPCVADTPQIFLVGHSKCDKLSHFEPLTENAIEKLLRSRLTKHCKLDPLPTWLLKDNCVSLLPLVTAIINTSLSSGAFPVALKTAILQPILKKRWVRPDDFQKS